MSYRHDEPDRGCTVCGGIEAHESPVCLLAADLEHACAERDRLRTQLNEAVIREQDLLARVQELEAQNVELAAQVAEHDAWFEALALGDWEELANE